MRLKHLLSVFLMLITCAVGQMWGGDKTGTLTMSSSQTSPVVNNGVTFTWTSSNIITGSGSGFKANSNMTITIPEGATLKSITKSNGNNWGSGATIYVYTGTSTSGTNIASIVTGTNTYNITSNNTGTTYYFANTTSKNAWINSLSVTYTEGASGPSITTSVSSLSDFTYSADGVPNKKTFTVSGANLTNNVTVTPPAGYEICETENGTYTDDAIELSKGTGTLSATTIYVRLKSDLSAGNKSGNIVCASQGVATSKNVALSGTVPCKITWKVSGETYQTTYVNSGGNLVLPTNPDICKTGTEFVGWSVSTINGTTNTKPTFVSSQTTISTSPTYHAVFATKTANSYTKGDINDLRPGQTVLIVNTNSSSNALSKAVVSGQSNKRLQSVSVSPDANNVISSMSNTNLIWTVENSGTKYNFKIGTKYLRATGSGQDKLAYGDNADPWTLTASSGAYLMKSNNSSSYYLEFYSSYFTTYSSNNPGAAYKMSLYVPTYTGYFTTCCTSLGSINGSFF